MRRSLEGKPTIPVTDCFGGTRPGWFDGERLECPFCWGVSVGQRCENPACPASRWATSAVFTEVFHAEALREEEQRWQRRHHEMTMGRIEDDKRRRAAFRQSVEAEATAKGACVRCALDSAHSEYATVKYVRHRNGCPGERR